MNQLRKLYIEIAAFLLWLLSILVNKTINLKVFGRENIDKVHESGQNIIFAFWHNASHPLFYYYRNTKTYILPIKKLEGEVLAHFAKKYNYLIQHLKIGGTPAERTETIIKLIKKLKGGHDVAIAVDGPPNEKLYDVKPGAIYLASKTGFPIIPAGIYAKHKFVMWWRWDKYIIPLPFSKVALVIGKPIYIDKNLSAEQLKIECKNLKQKIFELTKKAKSYLIKN